MVSTHCSRFSTSSCENKLQKENRLDEWRWGRTLHTKSREQLGGIGLFFLCHCVEFYLRLSDMFVCLNKCIFLVFVQRCYILYLVDIVVVGEIHNLAWYNFIKKKIVLIFFKALQFLNDTCEVILCDTNSCCAYIVHERTSSFTEIDFWRKPVFLCKEQFRVVKICGLCRHTSDRQQVGTSLGSLQLFAL